MIFTKLAQFFQKLESTPSRNEMVVILAQLFGESSVEEIDKVVYLTQGRVAPLYEPIEFGMGEKLVLKAVARATETTDELVLREFKKMGDVGMVVESLRDKKFKSITIKEVFEKLLEIAKSGGGGSVEKKGALLAELLKNCDPVSAKYIVKIVLDKLRLGFADMTVLEGLSWMLDGTKKHKDELEAAYNVRPDLGFIAQQFKSSKSLKVQPVVGTPILGMRAERLTSPEAILEKTGGKCAVEPKLDGLRTQLHYRKDLVRLYSRGLEDVTSMYPDLVAAAKEELDCREVILDGEAIGFDAKTGKYLPFQETVTRKRKYDIGLFSASVPLKLVVFDVLFADGENFIDKPYSQRRKYLEDKIKGKTIELAGATVVDKPAELEKIFGDCVKKGLEGIVAKKLDGIYQAGARGWNWIKFKKSYESKLADTIDAVVMGIDYGQGKRNKFGVGAFLIGIYDQKSDSYKTVSKVGTGLTDEEWKTLAVSSKRLAVSKKPGNYDVNKLNECDVWLKPEIVGEFRADELTKSPMHTAGYALRFPRLERWREKKPEDSTSLQEIIKLVNLKP